MGKVYGFGIYEKGKYLAKENNVHTASYKAWGSMLRRCYDKKFVEKWPTYKGCEVDSEWLNYQNFAEWYWSQKGAGNKDWHVDKDIISKGNKLYSKNTSFLLPPEINTIFDKKRNYRGQYPVGVTKVDNGFVARAMIYGERKYLGYYKTVEEAFHAYKTAKEAYLKEIADMYRGKISDVACDLLSQYVVEITD